MSWVIGHGFSTDTVQTCSTDMRTDMQYRHAVQTCRAVHHFLNSVKNLLQISMDDPNVNWKMLKLVKEDRKSQDPTSPDMLELGSCGHHVVHGAYYTGQNSTNWKLGKSLKSFHTLFKKSPAKRSDYLTINDLVDNHFNKKTEYLFPKLLWS